MDQKNQNKKIMKRHEKNISSLQLLEQRNSTLLQNIGYEEKIIQKLSNFINQLLRQIVS